jgi:hypothetical protein
VADSIRRVLHAAWQAQKFGAEILIPAKAAALDCTRAGPDGELALTLTDGRGRVT